MGATALPWSEIVAWAESHHSEYLVEWIKDPVGNYHPITTKHCSLADYELDCIWQMSAEYAAELSDNSPTKSCPKEIVIEEIDSLAESTALGEALMQMFGKKE